MELAWQAALLGLAALVLPLLIHLLARGQFKTVEVATTRFLRERTSQRFRRLQLEHPLLFALRVLLIVLCVMLLAEPYRLLKEQGPSSTVWNLVSPRLTASQANRVIEDGAGQSRWLAPGFPSLDQTRPVWRPHELWSLLSAADQLAPTGTAFHVVVPTVMSPPGLRSPSIDRAIRWIDGGSAASVSTQNASTLDVDIVFDAQRQEDATTIKTAVSAWQAVGIEASVRTTLIDDVSTLSTLVVWLSASPLPATAAGPRIIVAERPLLTSVPVLTGYIANGTSAVREQYDRELRVVSVEPLVASDRSTSPSLARDLLALFVGDRLTTSPSDYPVLQSSLLPAQDTSTESNPRVRQSMMHLFVWLIAVTAMLERWVSARIMRGSHDR